ncbi:hypothetical protein DUNSADRAFT_11523 [Dunaliella salina]|uniref:Uncharacterized protein n=1 Tax=Dunaliella salina TaxID=3046 RepID=A0ABQ7H4F7_DUNSA|nr:hypothetical protein DUNSADRAFT_11523 [Dunaliella salina]|eukprot:KAF5841743.1 hypothetical protein DUNSADRAFT_11523 [Dunaliella salina]
MMLVLCQGETLASGTRGTPWRLEMNKGTGKVDTLAFANFSHALMVPTTSGGRGLVEVPVDYTKQPLSHDAEFRDKVGKQMLAVGMAIEDYFGKEPQDIEGGLVTGSGKDMGMVVFQTRPQL